MADIDSTAIYVVAGAYLVPKLADLVVSFFKGSVTRNIDAADKAQAEVKASVEAAKASVEALRKDTTNIERKVERLEDAHNNHKDAMQSALGQIEGRLVALDNRVAAQGKAYEEKIEAGFKKLEIELNRKLAQFVSDVETERPRRQPGRR